MRIKNFALVAIPAILIGATAVAVSAREAGPSTCDGETVTVSEPSGYLTNVTPIIRGTKGRDVIAGTTGPDVIYGFEGNDLICGWGGGDSIFAGKGHDVVFAGWGPDIVQGGLGRDTIYGGHGNDTLKGGKGPDTLYGQVGSDNLAGNQGKDILDGGIEWDTTDGGAGTDSCLGENIISCNEQGNVPVYNGTPESVLAIADYFFPAHQHDNLRRVLACENSGLSPTIEGHHNAPGDGIDYGVFQINSKSQASAIAAAVPTMSAKSQQIYAERGLVGALKDAHFNIEYAHYITQTETWRAVSFPASSWRSTRWGAWTCGQKTSPFWRF